VSAQLVIFDLDGTLTDSAQGIVSSFRHALGEIGAAVPDGDLAGRIVGPPMHLTLESMGLGARAGEAIAAYRADYTTRGWSMNSRCWTTCARRACAWPWPPPRPSPPPE